MTTRVSRTSRKTTRQPMLPHVVRDRAPVRTAPLQFCMGTVVGARLGADNLSISYGEPTPEAPLKAVWIKRDDARWRPWMEEQNHPEFGPGHWYTEPTRTCPEASGHVQ